MMREFIPSYSLASRAHRKALITAFKCKEFCPGVELFKEGQPNSTAYLLIEGEIRLDKKSKLPGNAPDLSNRMARSTNTEKPKKSLNKQEARSYLLGIRQKKSWVGEEIIFMNEDQPFLYTATTQRFTRAFTISRTKMFDIIGQMFPCYLNTLLRRSQTRFKLHK